MNYLQDPMCQYYISAALMAVPMARLFKRTGLHILWTGLLIVPLFGYVLCAGALTFQKWPKKNGGAA